ncbi:uncharacterized protein LAESUDRAFT_724189 [Laetiporus sulphureus 93-53]|uniref:Uncharacterized protein n=1 Tax=Laetiporus sulphureus 93-53 TaxID=1314785 RepID=A0A165F1K4_9APHY|nr:uncharacterized protein LAESUDRAFT_724189 [Laetiporus sulphureus 93-53]KZT08179.1 hypothetical protein LAESUDRAFT_724189 [Laetiporus sulphureus 93-53]
MPRAGRGSQMHGWESFHDARRSRIAAIRTRSVSIRRVISHLLHAQGCCLGWYAYAMSFLNRISEVQKFNDMPLSCHHVRCHHRRPCVAVMHEDVAHAPICLLLSEPRMKGANFRNSDGPGS